VSWRAVFLINGPLIVLTLYATIRGVAIAASFYAGLASRVPGLDPNSATIRREIAPLNRPAPNVSPDVAQAAKEASTGAFHPAMYVAAGPLFAGAAVNAVGIQNPRRALALAVEAPPARS